MGKVIIPVYFDYASTLCYIAWKIVSELESELDFEALWKGVPISLRDFKASAGNQVGPREHQKVRIAAAETGVAVELPKSWTNSDAALQGAELARESNAFGAYHSAVFRAAFEDRHDIANLEVLGDLAQHAGMDRARFIADLRSHRMASRIADNKREADRFSALGYPTFVLGEFPLTGIQPIGTMRMLFSRYIGQRAGDPGN